MPKCFFTGIEIQLETAYLLDRGAAQRAARNLRQRLAAVDRLLSQLGPKDLVEMADRRTGAKKKRPQRRLVCQTVAAALAACYPESPLFVTWREFTGRRPMLFRANGSKTSQAASRSRNPGNGNSHVDLQ